MTSIPELTADDGFVASGFEAVAETFARTVGVDGEAGGAFAALVDGETVVDLCGGVADRARGIAWRPDTLTTIYSGTKGLVATCVLMLVDRGALDLETPVAAYWPELAVNGKEGILVRHVLSHTAGLPGLTTPVTAEESTDHERMARLLAQQPPVYAPGTVCAYHLLTYGWLTGELVRRVDGRSVGRFFREEVAEPLRLDAWIGLPQEQEPRVAPLERTPGFGTEVAPREDGGPDAVDEHDRIVWSVLDNPADRQSFSDTRAWRAAEVPAANGVATAHAMARLYGCLARGGELDGVRLMSPGTAALAGREIIRGHDPYRELPIGYALGFHLNGPEEGLGPLEEEAFGHGGAGGSMHGCWPKLRTGFSFATNLLDGPVNPRAARLLGALHAAVEGAS